MSQPKSSGILQPHPSDLLQPHPSGIFQPHSSGVLQPNLSGILPTLAVYCSPILVAYCSPILVAYYSLLVHSQHTSGYIVNFQSEFFDPPAHAKCLLYRYLQHCVMENLKFTTSKFSNSLHKWFPHGNFNLDTLNSTTTLPYPCKFPVPSKEFSQIVQHPQERVIAVFERPEKLQELGIVHPKPTICSANSRSSCSFSPPDHSSHVIGWYSQNINHPPRSSPSFSSSSSPSFFV